MKYILIIFLFYSTGSFAQSKIYDLDILSLDSSSISLKNYQGKKMLIATASFENLGKDKLQFLDSIQQRWPTIQVIVLPSKEAASEKDEMISASIKNSKTNIKVAAATYLSKEKADEQTGLIKYLTNSKENKHFTLDASTEFQVFVVSESGNLFAVLDAPVDMKALDEALHQKDINESRL